MLRGDVSYGSTWTGTTLWQNASTPSDRSLATYQFFPSPLRFSERAHAQVNWHYDTGHNVPLDLCPEGEGCAIAYQIMSYWRVHALCSTLALVLVRVLLARPPLA